MIPYKLHVRLVEDSYLNVTGHLNTTVVSKNQKNYDEIAKKF